MSGGPAVSPVRVEAIHMSGVRSLAAGRVNLELRFADTGLHIFDLEDRRLVGQLSWSEITAVGLERRRLVRGRRAPRLSISTSGGRAVFSLPGLTRRQVQDNLGPILRTKMP